MYIVENTQKYTISGVWGSAPHPKSNSSPPTEPNHTALIQPCSEAPCGWGGMTGPWAACSSQARGGSCTVSGAIVYQDPHFSALLRFSQPYQSCLVHQRLPGTARLPETPPEFPEPVLLICHSPDSLAPRPASHHDAARQTRPQVHPPRPRCQEAVQCAAHS